MKGGYGRDKVASSAASTPPPAEAAMAELLTRIMSMDLREAHRQMCLAQDEVARLQRQARQEPTNEAESGGAAETDGEESNKGPAAACQRSCDRRVGGSRPGSEPGRRWDEDVKRRRRPLVKTDVDSETALR